MLYLSHFLNNPKIRKYKEGFSAKSYIRCMHDGLECILSVSIVKRAVVAHDFNIGCFFYFCGGCLSNPDYLNLAICHSIIQQLV